MPPGAVYDPVGECTTAVDLGGGLMESVMGAHVLECGAPVSEGMCLSDTGRCCAIEWPPLVSLLLMNESVAVVVRVGE